MFAFWGTYQIIFYILNFLDFMIYGFDSWIAMYANLIQSLLNNVFFIATVLANSINYDYFLLAIKYGISFFAINIISLILTLLVFFIYNQRT